MEMPKNAFKARLTAGQQQIGCWLSLPGPVAAEALATCGFDWIVVDTEHAPVAVQDTLPALQAVAAYPGVSPIVRVLENDTATIKQALDIGAQTLMVPYVQSAEEAAAAVTAMRYAPRGLRGMAGGTRATRFGLVDGYAERAEDELCLVVQVETVAALEQLEAIATTDGVHGVFIGPADLAASLGYSGDTSHPEVRRVILETLSRLRDMGVPAGMLAPDPEFARACIEAGSTFTAVGIDLGLMIDSARTLSTAFKR